MQPGSDADDPRREHVVLGRRSAEMVKTAQVLGKAEQRQYRVDLRRPRRHGYPRAVARTPCGKRPGTPRMQAAAWRLWLTVGGRDVGTLKTARGAMDLAAVLRGAQAGSRRACGRCRRPQRPSWTRTGNHAPMSGSHAHSPHPAYGSQGDDGKPQPQPRPRRRRQPQPLPRRPGRQRRHPGHRGGKLSGDAEAARAARCAARTAASRSASPPRTAASSSSAPGPGWSSVHRVHAARRRSAMPSTTPPPPTRRGTAPPQSRWRCPTTTRCWNYRHAWEDSDAASVPHKDGRRRQRTTRRVGNPLQVPPPQDQGRLRRTSRPCRNGLARAVVRGHPVRRRRRRHAHLQAHLNDGGSDAEDHTHHDLSGMDLDEIRAALKRAHAMTGQVAIPSTSEEPRGVPE